MEGTTPAPAKASIAEQKLQALQNLKMPIKKRLFVKQQQQQQQQALPEMPKTPVRPPPTIFPNAPKKKRQSLKRTLSMTEEKAKPKRKTVAATTATTTVTKTKKKSATEKDTTTESNANSRILRLRKLVSVLKLFNGIFYESDKKTHAFRLLCSTDANLIPGSNLRDLMVIVTSNTSMQPELQLKVPGINEFFRLLAIIDIDEEVIGNAASLLSYRLVRWMLKIYGMQEQHPIPINEIKKMTTKYNVKKLHIPDAIEPEPEEKEKEQDIISTAATLSSVTAADAIAETDDTLPYYTDEENQEDFM
jgi:hypothetical protein